MILFLTIWIISIILNHILILVSIAISHNKKILDITLKELFDLISDDSIAVSVYIVFGLIVPPIGTILGLSITVIYWISITLKKVKSTKGSLTLRQILKSKKLRFNKDI